MSGVISPLIWVIAVDILLITLIITTHEPPSTLPSCSLRAEHPAESLPNLHETNPKPSKTKRLRKLKIQESPAAFSEGGGFSTELGSALFFFWGGGGSFSVNLELFFFFSQA